MSFSSPQSFFLFVLGVYNFWADRYVGVYHTRRLSRMPPLSDTFSIIKFPSESSLIIMIIDDCRRTHLSNAETLTNTPRSPNHSLWLFIMNWTLLIAILSNAHLYASVQYIFTASIKWIDHLFSWHHRCRFSNDSYINKELNDQQQTFLSLWKNKTVCFFPIRRRPAGSLHKINTRSSLYWNLKGNERLEQKENYKEPPSVWKGDI